MTEIGPDQDGYSSSAVRGDPSVCFSASGEVYVAYVALLSGTTPTKIICTISSDGGASFSDTTTHVVADTEGPPATKLDKPWITVGPRSGTSGERIYVTYSIEGDGIHVAASNTDTISFSDTEIPGTSPQSLSHFFSMPTVDDQGRLYVSWLYAPRGLSNSQGFSHINVARSDDEGVTFAVSQVGLAYIGDNADTKIPATPNRGIFACPSIAVDTSGVGAHSGRVYVAYTTKTYAGQPADDDTDILIHYSDDFGASWSEPRMLHKGDGNSQFMSWISVDPSSGAVYAAWYDAREDTTGISDDDPDCPDYSTVVDCRNEKTRVYASVSLDGGENWYERPVAESLTDWGNTTYGFFEYLGCAAIDDTLHITWNGGRNEFTGDGDTYYDQISLGSFLANRTIAEVPSFQYPTVQAAINTLLAGDTIRVVDDVEGPFVLASNVPIIASGSSGRPIIDADGAPHAVTIPLRYSGAGLHGFRVVGWTESGVYCPLVRSGSYQTIVVEDCVIEGPEGSGACIRAVDKFANQGYPAASPSTILVTRTSTTGSDTAMAFGRLSVLVEDCRIENPASVGISAIYTDTDSTYARPVPFQFMGNVIAEGEATEGSSFGIKTDAPPIVGGLIVNSNTVNGFDTGIFINGEAPVFVVCEDDTLNPFPFCTPKNDLEYMCCEVNGQLLWVCVQLGTGCGQVPSEGIEYLPYEVAHNMVSEYLSTGIRCGGIEGDVSCNNIWSSHASSDSLDGCDFAASNSFLEPLYCGESGDTLVAEFSLRIDSPGAPGNSICGELIGALPVECAWDTLARSTTVVSDTDVRVLEDLVVPIGTSLTLESDVTFRFDTEDDSESGVDQDKNELVVIGSLDVEGEDGAPVVFRSTEAAPADTARWWGIRVWTVTGGAGDATIDYASVSQSDWGIVYATNQAGAIRNSAFADNDLTDIKTGGTSESLEIRENDINVGGGIGMDIAQADSVVDNTVDGDLTSSTGIQVVSSGSSNEIGLRGNEVEGLATGNGIKLGGSSTYLFQNRVLGGIVGVLATAGSHRVGSGAEIDLNRVDGNTTAFKIQRSGPDCPVSSAMDLSIHRNDFWNYSDGLLAVKAPNDTIAPVDAGVSVSGSGRGLNFFKNDNPPGIGEEFRAIVAATTACDTLLARANYFGDNAGTVEGEVDTTGALAPPLSRDFPTEAVVTVPSVRILGAYPNPTTGRIRFDLSVVGSAQDVEVHIVDVAGRLVRRLADMRSGTGQFSLEWDGLDTSGARAASGIYFARARTSDRVTSAIRIVLAR